MTTLLRCVVLGVVGRCKVVPLLFSISWPLVANTAFVDLALPLALPAVVWLECVFSHTNWTQGSWTILIRLCYGSVHDIILVIWNALVI